MKTRTTLLATAVLGCTFPSVTYEPSGPDATSDAPIDAGAAGDGTTNDAGDPCDQDHDGWRSLACEGGDCNDHDPRMHPEAGWVFDVPDSGPILGDWNCDGKVDLLYPNVVTSCLTSCGALGFGMSTWCGASGYLVSCVGTAVCGSADAGFATQGCE